MSVSRSVAAAQRRRAGPPEPQQINRGPATSINSSQMFSQQRQQQQGGGGGGGSNNYAQKQQQQQQQQQQQGLVDQKMTIPQAITLITLRLGRIESQLLSLQNGQSGDGYSFAGSLGDNGENENMALVDKTLIQSIVARLESLEKRSQTAPQTNQAPGSSMEITTLKQQTEVLKNAIITNKNETKELKANVEVIRSSVDELHRLHAEVQQLSLDNNQKLLTLSLLVPSDVDCDFENSLVSANIASSLEENNLSTGDLNEQQDTNTDPAVVVATEEASQ